MKLPLLEKQVSPHLRHMLVIVYHTIKIEADRKYVSDLFHRICHALYFNMPMFIILPLKSPTT